MVTIHQWLVKDALVVGTVLACARTLPYLCIERKCNMGKKQFLQGNQAMAESAIRAGCKLFFGYPITPSSEVPEYYARAMRERPEEGITFIQA